MPTAPRKHSTGTTSPATPHCSSSTVEHADVSNRFEAGECPAMDGGFKSLSALFLIMLKEIMLMIEQQYSRNKNVIRDTQNNIVFDGKTPTGESSINAAKRESRKLQGSALGQGLLRVEK